MLDCEYASPCFGGLRSELCGVGLAFERSAFLPLSFSSRSMSRAMLLSLEVPFFEKRRLCEIGCSLPAL